MVNGVEPLIYGTYMASVDVFVLRLRKKIEDDFPKEKKIFQSY
jgi:DNA-binding response OmpR family regulator